MATIAKKVPYEHFVILLYRFPFTFRFSLKYVDICSQKKLFQNCFVFFILYHFLILFSDIWHINWKKNSLILRKHVFGSNENMIIYTIFYNQRIIKGLLLENLLLQFFFCNFSANAFNPDKGFIATEKPPIHPKLYHQRRKIAKLFSLK